MKSFALFGLIALSVPLFLFAEVSSSTNYQIISDSLNSGGGFGTSSNYVIESTVGEQATGYSTSTNFSLHAGYQQMDTEVFISISTPADVPLANISGLLGGTSKGTAAWTVVTDNNTGYTLTIQATSSPALHGPSGASFGDYTPLGADPDFVFTVNAASSTFGFSPEGTHITARFKDNGSACNTGSNDASDRCYAGLATIPQTIAESGSANVPSGTITTARFAAGIGASKIQDSGAYTATVIMTAIPQ